MPTNHPLSRRTWLLASGSVAVLGVLASCRPRDPTRVPEGGPAPPAPLTERGIRNLLALAELGAAIRWLHPSDQASTIAWEPLLLAGVRELELAEHPEQLAEGLRSRIAEVAPTVQIWRSASEVSDRLDALACPDLDVGQGPTRALASMPKPKPERPTPPAPATRGESEESDSGESESGESESSGESGSEESDSDESDSSGESDSSDESDSSGESDSSESESTETETGEPTEPTPALEPQPRPELPAVLFAETEAIVQWRRRGFASSGERDSVACAERIALPANQALDRDDELAEFEPLAPAAPALVELERGLTAAIPLALWWDGGEIEPPASFTAEQAAEYTLDDRGTRLLAVIQIWSILRWFSPGSSTSLREPLAPLRRALCQAAEREADAMPAILDELLAKFADGNAERLDLDSRPGRVDLDSPREFRPAAGFAWAAERVVALPLVDRPDAFAPLQPGDVIVAIAGEPIETRLAEQLPRTAGALASARITRAVDRLFVAERAQTQSGLRVEVLRDRARIELSLREWMPVDGRHSGADRRPRESLFELKPALWYVDLGRIPDVRLAARWLRGAMGVIVDLRGPMLDERRSLASHWLSAPLELLDERILAGPTPEGRLVPRSVAQHRLEPVPVRRRLTGMVAVLADARTRGRAERELVAFDRLGVQIVGSASAGDLAQTTTAQLPGGLRVRFSQTEMLRHDGTRLSGVGVAPTLAVEPSWPALAEHDELFERARHVVEWWG